MGGNSFNDPGLMQLVRSIMILLIVALFMVIICVVVVHFFPNRRRQATEDSDNCAFEHRGLDNLFLETIRVIQFDPERFKEGLECAICLSEVKEGEKTRVLPRCGHGFHMECIDMWFHSHSTCPICRKPVVDQSSFGQQDSITILIEGQEATDHHRESNLEQA